MRRLVYLAGLSHSGSTVLNLSLGGHPKLIALGEAYWVTTFSEAELEEELVMGCTCGKPVRDCEFWSKVFAAMLANLQLSPAEKYALLLDIFYEQFSEDAIPIDASKMLNPLQDILTNSKIDVSAIHLVRDVRSFTISRRDVISKEMQYQRIQRFTRSEKFDRWLHLWTTRSGIYLFYKWFLRNRMIARFLSGKKIKHTSVGYDQFALYPEESLIRISEFIGINYDAQMLIPDGTTSHVVFGNQMLGNKDRKARIRYDNRWFGRNDYQFAAFVSPHIMRYNAQMLYRKII